MLCAELALMTDLYKLDRVTVVPNSTAMTTTFGVRAVSIPVPSA